MIITTRTSVYKVRRATKDGRNGYAVKKIALLSGSESPAVSVGRLSFGDKIVFGKHLELFFEGKKVLETTTIEDGF